MTASSIERKEGSTSLVTILLSEMARVINVMASRVSSPYAGVHRYMRGRRSPRQRVFPVRGGSPYAERFAKVEAACLPRTRGFTGDDLAALARCAVSSPYAGVHRAIRSRPSSTSRVFPVRGGSPKIEEDLTPAMMCLPRTRGFTSGTKSNFTPLIRVFPVRGGSPVMDRTLQWFKMCLPRTRGFTEGRNRAPPAWTVSSPYAGVHLPMTQGPRPSDCVFPVRGGSPQSCHACSRACQCLPRTCRIRVEAYFLSHAAATDRAPASSPAMR
jgi:hypothetical protein